MKLSHSAIRFFGIMIIVALVVSCTSKTGPVKVHAGVEYYRSLQFSETPYDIEKGVHPLTADQARTVNSYKFTYDDAGRLSNLYSGWSKRINTFDENGYVLETVIYDQDNELLSGKGVPVIQNVYDVHGAIVESKNLDKDRMVINHPQSGVAITKYKYDEAGQRIETLRLDKDGVPVKA